MPVEYSNAAIALDSLVEVFVEIWMIQGTEWFSKNKGGCDVESEGPVCIAQIYDLADGGGQAIVKLFNCLLYFW